VPPRILFPSWLLRLLYKFVAQRLGAHLGCRCVGTTVSLLQNAMKRKPPPVFPQEGVGNPLFQTYELEPLGFSPKWMDKVLPELVQPTDLSRLWTFRAVFDSELHTLALLQVSESIADDGRVMDENVLRASVRLDESVPLHAAEPLDRTLRSVCHPVLHLPFLLWLLRPSQRPGGWSQFHVCLRSAVPRSRKPPKPRQTGLRGNPTKT
jgi:hypothetical protein